MFGRDEVFFPVVASWLRTDRSRQSTMATPAVAHSSSSKNLAKELKPRIEKAQKAASELQIGEVYIKDKLKMAAETVTVLHARSLPSSPC